MLVTYVVLARGNRIPKRDMGALYPYYIAYDSAFGCFIGNSLALRMILNGADEEKIPSPVSIFYGNYGDAVDEKGPIERIDGYSKLNPMCMYGAQTTPRLKGGRSETIEDIRVSDEEREEFLSLPDYNGGYTY